MIRHALFAGFVALVAAAVAWPGPLILEGRTGPLVLGLPPALWWNLGWIGAGFVALLVYDLSRNEP